MVEFDARMIGAATNFRSALEQPILQELRPGRSLALERPLTGSTEAVLVAGLIAFVLVVVVAVTIFALRRYRRWADAPPTMTMSFQIGTTEKHTVNVAFTQPVDRLVIGVDGQQVVNKGFAAGARLTGSMEVIVGVAEQHVVRIDKRRQLLYGAFNPQQFTASVDGVVLSRAESRIPARSA